MSKTISQYAFIFDLDGVLINNEPLWEKAKKEMFTELFGLSIYTKLGSTVGVNITAIHERAVKLGTKVSLEQLYDAFTQHAAPIYSKTPITDGISELGQKLIQYNYAIGIVSSSPRDWIDLVIDRLIFKKSIAVIFSLDKHPELKQKPAPDGYVEAIKQLGATPSTTFILEDSNTGITSAKAAGAYVIGLRQNLVEGYLQKGADVSVNKVEDVYEIVKNFTQRNHSYNI